MPLYRRATTGCAIYAFLCDAFLRTGRHRRPQRTGLAQRSAATGTRATYAGLKARRA